MTLHIATHSEHKLNEIRAMLRDVEVLGLKDLDIEEDIPETGDTLEDNAIIKARYLWSIKGETALAEDTGLEVYALDGQPGVKTARYAGVHRDNQDNINLLLSNLEGNENRKARFRTIIALVNDKETLTFEGIVEGRIAWKQSGESGFGYDPVFIPDGYEKTFAELTTDIKNNISHRAMAVRKLMEYVKLSCIRF